jgi:hypothetical protein
MELTAQQRTVLRAISEGRVPRDEAFVAKLKRRGLITRSVHLPHAGLPSALHLTDEGAAALAESDGSTDG